MRAQTICRLTIAVSLVSLLVSTSASARPWRQGGLGAGVILGQPTGLTLESRLSRSSSVDLAVGLNTFHRHHDDNGYAHLEYIVRFLSLSHSRRVSIPLYLGIGAFVSEHGDLHAGARVPLGLSFEFRAPIQFFLELSLRAILLSDHDASFDLDGAGGFRVFF